MHERTKEKNQKDNTTQKTTLGDIVSLERLQTFQDHFASATNVSSIIIDLHGNPITKPSNFSNICRLISKTELGKYQCSASDLERRKLADEIDQPTYLKCHPCGFADASVPIFHKDERVANWLIGQVNLNSADRNEIVDYASVIGVDISAMLVAFDNMPKMSPADFESIIKFIFNESAEVISLCRQDYADNLDNASIQNEFIKLLSKFKK